MSHNAERRRFVAGALIAAFASRASLAGATTAWDPRHDADTILRQSLGDHAFPGAQIAIMESGRLIHSRGFGDACLMPVQPVTPTTSFHIASLTKQFAAAAAVKLHVLGKLSLSAPVHDYLPFMAKLPMIRVEELMHHSAGLHSDESATPAPGSQIEIARAIAAQPKVFDFPSGTAWLYSNANYLMLGAVIEAVTGHPLRDAFAQLLFRPIGLRHTALSGAHEHVRGGAHGYQPADDHGVFPVAEAVDFAATGAAGAIRSTATDLCRWHYGLFSGRLFGQDGIRLMLTPGRLRDGRLTGANRFSPDDANYGDVQYAGGLLVSPPTDRRRSVLHYGFYGGFSAMLATNLDDMRTIAALTNVDPNPKLPFAKLRKLILA